MQLTWAGKQHASLNGSMVLATHPASREDGLPGHIFHTSIISSYRLPLPSGWEDPAKCPPGPLGNHVDKPTDQTLASGQDQQHPYHVEAFKSLAMLIPVTHWAQVSECASPQHPAASQVAPGSRAEDRPVRKASSSLTRHTHTLSRGKPSARTRGGEGTPGRPSP